MSTKGNVKLVRNAGLILAIVLYTVIRMIIVGRATIVGSAYFFSAFDFILLFIMGGSYCILDVVSKHCKAHMDLDCFKNAKRVLIYGGILAFLYSAIINIFILVFNRQICDVLLAGQNCSLTLMLLLPMLTFVCISAAFKGFYIGARQAKQAYLGLAAELLITCVCVIVCMAIFKKTGTKVAALMCDEKVLHAYVSAGAALGLSIGSGIGVVVDLVLFVLLSKRLVLIDETRRMVDVYDLSIQMISELLFLGVAMFIPILSVFVGQVILVKHAGEGSVDLYNIGAYYGLFGSVMTFLVLFTYIYSFFDKRSLYLAHIDNNRQELRSKVNNMIKLFFTYSLPAVAIVIVLSDVICKVIVSSSGIASDIIRLGSIAVIFYAFGIMFMNVLVAINKTLVAIVDGIIAIVLDSVFTVFLISKFDLGVHGLIISFYAFSIIYAVLIYLSASSGLKCKLKLISSVVGPIIVALITGAVCLVFRLILGLFAPAVVVLIIPLLVSLIVMFVAYIKLGITDYHHVCKSPISFVLVPLGRILGLFK